MPTPPTGDHFAPGSTSPDAGAKLVNEFWSRDIERAVTEKAKFFSTISTKPRLFNKLYIRKLGAVSSWQTMADTDPGNDLTYQTMADSQITITPKARYVAVAISRSQIAQMDVDPRNPIRQQVDEGMAALLDNDTLQLVASLTTTVKTAATGIDRPTLLTTLAEVRAASDGAVDPGRTSIRLLLWPLQYDDFMSIPEITSANIRGGGESPNVKGMTYDALGLNVDICGNIHTTGGEAYNVVYVPDAFGISFNERITVMAQEFELQYRIIAYANFGSKIIWDERAAAIKTPDT